MSGAGSFLDSFSTSYTKQKDYQRQKADLAAREADRLSPNGASAPAGGGYGGTGAPSAGDNSAWTAPASPNMPAYQRAFLDGISHGESPNGAYDVRYTPQGGAKFDLNGTHPQIYEPGPAGKSSAAGRYQFTYSTWKDIAGENTPFTPENQDKYAWNLASQRYKASTGGDLDSYVQQYGMTPDVQRVLTPTWASMNNDEAGRAAIYAKSLASYSAPTAPVARSIPAGGYSLGVAQ